MKAPSGPKTSCPHCGKDVEYRSVPKAPFFPFCSERCKLVDLGKWLDGEHRISEPPDPKETDRRAPGKTRDD